MNVDWERLRLDRLFREVKDKEPLGDHELLTPSTVYGIIPQRDLVAKPQQALRDGFLVIPTRVDDFVISMSSFRTGIERSSLEGGITADYTVLRLIRDRRLAPYLGYALKSDPMVQQLTLFRSGIRQGQRLQWNRVRYLDVLVPPANIAERIAAYLDRETGRIDALMERLKRLIALLTEKRQAVISRAVTKGLDPSAPMKDSGIDWLGDVPSHWEVKQVKHAIDYASSGSRGWSDYYSDEGAVFLQSGNIGRAMDVDWGEAQRVSLPERAEGQRTRIAKNDILVCITGGRTGAVGIVENDPEEAYVNQHIALVRPSEAVVPDFLSFCLFSDVTSAQFALYQYGGTKEGLGLENVKDVRFAFPPKEEQQAIAVWLREQTRALDQGSAKITGAIGHARERRAALISAAVTGQISLSEMEAA